MILPHFCRQYSTNQELQLGHQFVMFGGQNAKLLFNETWRLADPRRLIRGYGAN